MISMVQRSEYPWGDLKLLETDKVNSPLGPLPLRGSPLLLRVSNQYPKNPMGTFKSGPLVGWLACLHVFVLSSESVKYYHGEAYKYMIKSPTDLGKVRRFCFCFCIVFVNVLQQITVVQIHWIYDDEMKLFDLSRICLMFLCSKHLYTNTVTVNSVAVDKG